MLIEINIEVRKTGEGLFEGEIALHSGNSGEKRDFNFTLSTLELIRGRAHLVVYCDQRQIFSSDASDLTEAQSALINLVHDAMQMTLSDICKGDVGEEHLRFFKGSGIDYNLTAKGAYDVRVSDQSEHSKVNQLFQETQ